MSEAKPALGRAAILAVLLAVAACQAKPTQASEDPKVQRAEAAVRKALGAAQDVSFEEVAQCGDVADTAGGYVTGVSEKGAFQATFMYVRGEVAFSNQPDRAAFARLSDFCTKADAANTAEINASMANDATNAVNSAR